MKLYPPGYEELQAPAEQERGAEIRRRLQAALEPAEALAAHRLEEIGRLEDVLRVDRIAREERPVPTAILDPGIPARAADRVAPEIPAVAPEEDLEEAPPEASGSGPETEPAEETKVCKRCGEKKPLSAYGKDVRTADGLGRTCSDCKASSRQAAAARESRKGGSSHAERRKKGESTQEAEREKIREFAEQIEAAEVTELRSKTPEAKKRSCANGTSCTAVDPDDIVPTPAILDGANPGPLCRRCQKRAGVA